MRPDQLLVANGGFEATSWTATALGPPLGGAALGILGPVTTVVANAASYLLSALGLFAIGRGGPPPTPRTTGRSGASLHEIGAGWRYLLRHDRLRPLYLNAMLVNGLIMAASPVLAVLCLHDLGYAPWQYFLGFGVPRVGGPVGSRLARPLVTRFGQRRVLRVAGGAAACRPVGLAFVMAPPWGLLVLIAVEFGVIFSCGVFNPVPATYRLERTPADRVARVLSAWSVSTRASVALCTAGWGLLATALGPRPALAIAGLLPMLLCPLLLRSVAEREHREPAAAESPAELPHDRAAR